MAPQVFEWQIHYNNRAAIWIFGVRFGEMFLYITIFLMTSVSFFF
jgi:hypothetical protein